MNGEMNVPTRAAAKNTETSSPPLPPKALVGADDDDQEQQALGDEVQEPEHERARAEKRPAPDEAEPLDEPRAQG